MAEEGSRILVEDDRSWELNGEPSESNANMNYSARCSGWISSGVEYWCVTWKSLSHAQNSLSSFSGRITNNRL